MPLMQHANEPSPLKPRVFVSYAHADESDGRWKSKILPTLRALKTGGII
jgi:hypothetical protein